jgi:hypothetical protein
MSRYLLASNHGGARETGPDREEATLSPHAHPAVVEDVGNNPSRSWCIREPSIKPTPRNRSSLLGAERQLRPAGGTWTWGRVPPVAVQNLGGHRLVAVPSARAGRQPMPTAHAVVPTLLSTVLVTDDRYSVRTDEHVRLSRYGQIARTDEPIFGLADNSD